jgi:aminoglycoside phosphotransferase (APT) family kinase protein
VPEPILCCTDATVIGSEFYLMEYLEGDFLPDGVPNRFQSKESKRQIGETIIDSLVAIHEFDSEDVPLEPTTSSDEFLHNEVTKWLTQLEQATAITESERSLPDYDAVSEWLEANIPNSNEAVLLHGDYKPDNLMFAQDTPPKIVGILDWEMSGIGDPLTDLGWLLSYWADPDDDRTTARTYMRDEQFHDRSDLVERYEAKSGREFLHHRFYRALAVFKLAAICEGFYATYVRGSESTKQSYPVMEMLVPELLKRTDRIINGEEPI